MHLLIYYHFLFLIPLFLRLRRQSQFPFTSLPSIIIVEGSPDNSPTSITWSALSNIDSDISDIFLANGFPSKFTLVVINGLPISCINLQKSLPGILTPNVVLLETWCKKLWSFFF